MATNDLKIENTDIKTAPGVELSSEQKVIVGSILDLFAGKPSLPKLRLWSDEAVFEDPITQARGRKQYEPQWTNLFLSLLSPLQYGLKAAFSEIERLHHEVTSAGNPILMSLKTRYVVKGIQKETTINSVVSIATDSAGTITKVEDRWDGSLPDSSIANAFRRLNAVSVPKMVGVPKNDEEDAKMGNQ
ncbi:hypothetical protein DBV05_g10399 [Lasiodiplodia theobromae]|uniref:SnoaL-like domain-containing protein n=1 Tax=Lasiodiplodia theobromae TaxID=45133 RepID=A0A5N5CZX1_9PEZI|nr:hypothetical protein DBV05_g10399 [Lasiodiplodia theobromae]